MKTTKIGPLENFPLYGSIVMVWMISELKLDWQGFFYHLSCHCSDFLQVYMYMYVHENSESLSSAVYQSQT